ncbi:MAG TPA: AraC family ligand binding domain-containing protein [Polyangiales bacterium]|nr:AraC family ligand binding domain-containing protein [Polyangiales bacterium]
MTFDAAFRPFDLSLAGCLYELGSLRVHSLGGGQLALEPGHTYWLLVTADGCVCELADDRVQLRAERYLVGCGPGLVRGGQGLVIEQRDYQRVRQWGGPLEPLGRLRYVDGCTDSLLVCPPRSGDACLNHLHIPAHTRQSEHSHPSLRLGVIARGEGVCRTAAGETALHAGLGWLIPPGLVHGFSTTERSLDVLAWHPDSDFGPTDGDHPMLNRTFLQR